MSTLRSTTAAFAFAAFATACGPMDAADEAGDFASDDELSTSSYALSLLPADAKALLDAVNHPGTDAAALKAAGVEKRAATNVLAHRMGADGRDFTADDDLFDSVAELDAVSYVGDVAFDKLAAFAKAHPAPAGEVVELVTFKGWEAQTVIWGVNTVDVGVLNGMLDNRAAANLMAARPFANVAGIGKVALIGSGALERLRREAKPWWSAMKNAPVLAGTFDGVTFDEATATAALRLASTATRSDFLVNGIYADPASVIIGNRPYTSLAAVAAVSGVGPGTMQALSAWAKAPATGGVDPVPALKANLEALTADIWWPSETDARLMFVSSNGIGNAPITAELIRTRLGAQHDALISQVMYISPGEELLSSRPEVEELNANDYLNHIINAADENDPDSLARAAQIATFRDALNAQLTDLKVFRFGRISISVFIIGRTPNGALAGMLTGQVET